MCPGWPHWRAHEQLSGRAHHRRDPHMAKCSKGQSVSQSGLTVCQGWPHWRAHEQLSGRAHHRRDPHMAKCSKGQSVSQSGLTVCQGWPHWRAHEQLSGRAHSVPRMAPSGMESMIVGLCPLMLLADPCPSSMICTHTHTHTHTMRRYRCCHSL